MLGFSKKSKKDKEDKDKDIEFELITMSNASEAKPGASFSGEKKEVRLKAPSKKKTTSLQKEKGRGENNKKEELRHREEELKKEERTRKAKEAELKEKELELKKEEEKIKEREKEQKNLLQEELERQKRIEKESEELEKRKRQQGKNFAKQQQQIRQKTVAQKRKTTSPVTSSKVQSTSPFLETEDVPKKTQGEPNNQASKQAREQATAVKRTATMPKDHQEKNIAEERQPQQEQIGHLERISTEPTKDEEAERLQKLQQSSLSSDLDQKESRIKKLEGNKAQKNKKAADTKAKLRKTKINKPLLWFAVFILLLTSAAGAYYYYFVLNTPEENWTPLQMPEIPEIEMPDIKPQSQDEGRKEQIEESDTGEEITPLLKPNTLKKASLRSINPGTFSEDLGKLIATLKDSPDKSQKLESGLLIKLTDQNGKQIETASVLNLLGIKNEQLHQLARDEVWLFLTKQSRNTVSGEGPVVKVNLIISLSKKTQPAELEGSVLLFEDELLNQCLGLFIDEEKPNVPENILFKTSKTDNQSLPQTRYCNYEDGNSKKSVDWGIANYIDENYLIISTSKNSTDLLLDMLK